ncbi:hypothetical protein CRG98_019952 [Punica granatum]|uniref:Uncharacterized protein n=1 Tax=Punica granatum TaxID=22663 RepID=A0A2I0JVZ7_PUNGR|nr:hypothetical protein CRG98_019952 [Punica granatum]
MCHEPRTRDQSRPELHPDFPLQLVGPTATLGQPPPCPSRPFQIELTRDLSFQAATTVTSRGPLAIVDHQLCGRKPSGATVITFYLKLAQRVYFWNFYVLSNFARLYGSTQDSSPKRPPPPPRGVPWLSRAAVT